MTDAAFQACETLFERRGFVPLESLAQAATGPDRAVTDPAAARARLIELARHFNSTVDARTAIDTAAEGQGGGEARLLRDWMAACGLHPPPVWSIPAELAMPLKAELKRDPEAYVARRRGLYPVTAADQHWGFETGWIADRLASSLPRLERFVAARQSDVAVLVGNGPSLKQTDLTLLEGTDVFLSNYALRDPVLRRLGKAAAMTNHFVACQAPQIFVDFPGWRVLPVWLGHVLPDTENTIWLHGTLGPMYFSQDIRRTISWHATVSYFWMQVLYHAGYRKVLLIGFDHSYVQPSGLSNGALIQQHEADPNHFDPNYFRGKVWQAADVDQMAQTYVLAERAFAGDGREIVNCTVGGKLEVFRRGQLAEELAT